MSDLFWLTLLLFLVAAALRSELFFYLLYVVVGLQVLARLWPQRGARRLSAERRAPATGFPDEPLAVELELVNQSLLPIPWLSLSESIPPGLRRPGGVREVISLGARERRVIRYTVAAQRRGYYQLGPLALRTGDVLGLGELALPGAPATELTIFPRVLRLDELGLPAALPYGTLAAQQRLFSDPARPVGVRPYQAADGVRRIDWKTSAHAGAPVVRRYQPAIALETLVALAFSRQEYAGRYAYDQMEHALTAAASVAAHLVERGQPVGFCTTGLDPLSGGPAAALPVGRGRAHLIAVLAALGRLEPAAAGDLPALLAQGAARLGWGGTLVVITGQRGVELLAALLPLRQRGLNVALVLTEPTPDDLGLPRRHGIAAYGLWRDGRPSAT